MEQAVGHLQDVASQLIDSAGTEALYERILDAAMAILHSDCAGIQMYYPERRALRLLGHRGFDADAAAGWGWISASTNTSCGEVLRTGRMAVVEDVRTCDFLSGTDELKWYLKAGVRAMQSTPLVSRSGVLLGTVSAHWRQPHKLSADELQGLEILARMAADLLDRSRSDERLRESEERLRASDIQLRDAQRLARLGSWERNIKTGNSYWSDEMRRILGVPADMAPTFPAFMSYVHPRDRETVLSIYDRIYSTRAAVEAEFRIVRPDGELRFVRCIAEGIGNDQGDLIRTVGAVQDITDQVKAQELLRESETRLKNAERLAHLGHWNRDMKSNRVSWSEGLYRIVGKPLDYVPTHDDFVKSVKHPDLDGLKNWTADFLAGKRGKSSEFQFVRSDGDLRTLACVSEVSRDEQGTPVTLFGTIQDITEARRAQEESLGRQKMESLGMLASGIAHDFNNLLAGVLAQTELAHALCLAGLHPETELENIRKAALNGSEIVGQLMAYAGKTSAGAGAVNLSEIIEETLQLLRISLSKRIVVQTCPGPDLPRAVANSGQMRQIVMNLVMNASDAIGGRAGVIRVATRLVKAEPVKAEQNSPGGVSDQLADRDHLCLSVSDTGCGMSADTQAKVFDPFFTTKSAGRGLGLAVVAGTVRALGGEVRLTSEVGTGTTVQVLLPCEETVAGVISSPGSASVRSEQALQDRTLLIVEDEDTLRKALSKLLRRVGLEILEAADGDSAIEILHANGARIDGMLLDMTLPGASVRDIVTEAAKARSDIRIIFTSAYGPARFAEVMSIAQTHTFIPKPFRVEDFLSTLRTILSVNPGNQRSKTAAGAERSPSD